MLIGRFEIEEELGRGGMGVVYRAQDPVLRRPVAIKKLTLVTEEHLERFRQEARAAGRLHHPNITTLYECGDDAGEPYLVMEYLDGDSLRTLIRGKRLPPLPRRLVLLADVADALDYAHRQGVAAHRDIKPANIQVLADGTPKIMDFGIAKLADEFRLTRSLTQANTVLGTLSYMSPEQVRGERLDGRSDLWSLGIVLFEMLHGRRPFDDADDNETMKKIVLEDLGELPRLGVHEEDELQRILRRTLEKNPERRYPSGADLSRELRALAIAMEALGDAPVVASRRSAEEWFNDGRALYVAEEYARAAACFRRVLELVPDNRPAVHNLELCTRALAQKLTQEQFRLGILLFKNREHDLAISVLEDLLRTDPTNTDARQIIVWARRERSQGSREEGFDHLVTGTLENMMNESTDPGDEPTETRPRPSGLGGEG